MTGLTVTTKLTDLKTLFNDVKEIYFKSSEIKAADLGKAFTVDIEFPVLEEGVNFNTGDAEVTKIKLTTGSTWVSKATKGDGDISFQVASIAGPVNSLLMNKVGGDITSTEGILRRRILSCSQKSCRLFINVQRRQTDYYRLA